MREPTSTGDQMHMLIFGHGYTAAALTLRLRSAGWKVSGTTRGNPDRVTASGATTLDWLEDEELIRQEIGRADAILVSISPDGRTTEDIADPVIARFGEELAAARPFWVGYLSSTNVYGDHGGGWVDEATPPNPGMARATARLRSEGAWRDLAGSACWPLTIFRLAGIYGPGRGPFEKLRKGTARRIVKPGQVFSRIHVDDIAGAVMASLSQSRSRPQKAVQVFNLCDDDPAPPQDVIAKAASMIGMAVPEEEPFERAEMTPMARSFYSDSKRVSNERMKAELGYRLVYPDYSSGLAAILRAEKQTVA